MIHDGVRDGFLTRQYEEGMALAESSDILRLVPLEGSPPDRYAAEFHCAGLVRAPDGSVQEAGLFVVGVWFPSDYLRTARPWQVLTWIGPHNIYHPNISDRVPHICVGPIAPGTALVDLLYRCHDIITFKRVTMREDDALNPFACGYARDNQRRFPIDPRPLKRQTHTLRITRTAGVV